MQPQSRVASPSIGIRRTAGHARVCHSLGWLRPVRPMHSHDLNRRLESLRSDAERDYPFAGWAYAPLMVVAVAEVATVWIAATRRTRSCTPGRGRTASSLRVMSITTPRGLHAQMRSC